MYKNKSRKQKSRLIKKHVNSLIALTELDLVTSSRNSFVQKRSERYQVGVITHNRNDSNKISTEISEADN